MSGLEGKIALVTGGASGLGAATARALRDRRATVAIADIDEAGGRAIAEEIGGHFVAADVSSLEANREMVAFVRDRCGGLDLAFLNAGVASKMGVGDDFEEEGYRRAMGINLDGVVFGTVAALPAMHARGGGAIVATASLAGLTSVPYDPIYAANKHAVVGLARSLGPGLVEHGVRFNAVCPGFSESGIIAPIRQSLIDADIPIIAAETVAEAVIELLCGDMTGECWFVQAGRPAEAFGFRGIPGPRHAQAT